MIEALKTLNVKATPGPWKAIVSDKSKRLVCVQDDPKIGLIADDELAYLSDFEFIAAMRNALPKFLALYDAAKTVQDPDLEKALVALEEES